ncbi:MAG: SBBP repeat-containing protein [Acidobacteriota bacterium]|nr:SBBP repeat-containing protein [Acidobacteriota bacterium]
MNVKTRDLIRQSKLVIPILVTAMAGILLIAGTFADGQQAQSVSQPGQNELKASSPAVPVSFNKGKNWLVYFIPNEGQIDNRVKYYIAGKEKNIYFTDDGLTISLFGFDQSGESDGELQTKRQTIRLDFVGANDFSQPAGTKPENGPVYSFFRGKPENWKTGLAACQQVEYREVWPGVDLTFYGEESCLKSEFIIRPETDVSSIRMKYSGATGVSLNRNGELQIVTEAGEFFDEPPLAYQVKNGQKVSVSVEYVIYDEKTEASGLVSINYGFRVGEYDRSLPLIIDPAILIYSGYLGGLSNDRAMAVAVDSLGNSYITGWTGSMDFPTVIGPELVFNGPSPGTDAFVAKVNPSGQLVYCGYLGGGYNDGGTGIAVDSSGYAYICGYTFSPDFPVLVGPDTSYNGNITQFSDAFIAKLSPAGNTLIYSSYLGGAADDLAYAVAIDTSGRAYLVGTTKSSDFPAIVGPDKSYNGGEDVFVTRVAAAANTFEFSGFIGGSQNDTGCWLALDSSNNIYVTGYTNSTPGHKFPVKVGPKLTHSGGWDAFVAKVISSGSSLIYCGYIGGTGDDYGTGIAVDSAGCAYVTGTTLSSSGFPASGGPDTTYNGGGDAYLAKVKADGSSLVYAGFLGGGLGDFGLSVAVNSAGEAVVAGATDSSDFPLAGSSYFTYAGGRDSFMTVVGASGSGIQYSTYLGGSGNEEANGVALDNHGFGYLTGFTTSPNFPTLVGPFLEPPAGSGYLIEDAFISRLKLPPARPVNLRKTSASQTEISLAWNDTSENEDGFKLERKTSSTSWAQIASLGPNVTVYTDSGLNEGTSYFYRVKAYNNAGESAYSNELNVLTTPAAPANLTAEVINERKVNLSWQDKSGGEEGFRLERKAGSGNWGTVATLPANTTAYSDTTVVETTTYTYRVFAFNAGGDSPSSNEVSVTTPALTIPLAPSDLQATPLSYSQVRLSWTDNSFNEEGFKIERKEGSGGTYQQVGTTGEGVTTYNDSGLAEMTAYYYRVRAFNAAGNSAYSNEATVTTPENKPKIRLPIGEVAFGQVNVCEYQDLTTTIYNDGGAELIITAVARSSGSTYFTYAGPALPLTISPLSSKTVTIRFSPLSTGAESATFNVDSNDPNNPTAALNASGTGFIPTITIELGVERRTERVWIIRRDYGRITVVVNKSAPFTVTKYRLWRKISGGSYELRKEFTESELSYGHLVYLDTYLDKGKNYIYRFEAVDCTGLVIASSDEVGTQAILTPDGLAPRSQGKREDKVRRAP